MTIRPCAAREYQAPPILEKLYAYLREQHATTLPKSPLGTAIGYVIDRVSTHPARLVMELTAREWKRIQQASAAKATA